MLRFFLLLLLATGAAAPAVAQKAVAAKTTTKTALKDGAFRRQGVMMRIQNGKITRLTAPLKLANGTVVHPDGRVVSANGTQRLANGRAVNMQGGIVGLSDDMLTAATIEELDRLVTGYTPTVIAIPNSVSSTSTRTLARLERKAALLEQLTERLTERTAQTVPVSEEATRIDAELNSLGAKKP